MKGIAIAVAVIAVAAVAYLVGTGQLQSGLPIPSGSGEAVDLSQAFHSIIDPYMPDWMYQRHTDCINASGTWFDQADKVGCYNIPAGGWDSSQCSGPVMTYYRNVCEGLGAQWICTGYEVGCKHV